MQRIRQNIDDLVDSLQNITSIWRDDTAVKIEEGIERLESELSGGAAFNKTLIKNLLNSDFKVFVNIFRFFLEYSKDEMEGLLRDRFPNGIGVMAYTKDKENFAQFFIDIGLSEAVLTHRNRNWTWKDIIVERLKLGRGSAIKGQKRGRFLEDEIEKIIQNVFGNSFNKNCNFTGMHGLEAKAEFAIPNKEDPFIIFEAKAYGATGSKQTDVIGDIEKIIKAKKDATEFLFVTDGLTWKQRLSDFRKIIKFQNDGSIRKIYTLSMLDELEADLITLKSDFGM